MPIPNRDAVALSARTLGALFSYAPNSAEIAPLVAAFQDGSWQRQWPRRPAAQFPHYSAHKRTARPGCGRLTRRRRDLGSASSLIPFCGARLRAVSLTGNRHTELGSAGGHPAARLRQTPGATPGTAGAGPRLLAMSADPPPAAARYGAADRPAAGLDRRMYWPRPVLWSAYGGSADIASSRGPAPAVPGVAPGVCRNLAAGWPPAEPSCEGY